MRPYLLMFIAFAGCKQSSATPPPPPATAPTPTPAPVVTPACGPADFNTDKLCIKLPPDWEKTPFDTEKSGYLKFTPKAALGYIQVQWENGADDFDHDVKGMMARAVEAPKQKVAEGDTTRGKFIVAKLDPTRQPTPYKLWSLARSATQTFSCDAEWKGDSAEQAIVDACRSLQPK